MDLFTACALKLVCKNNRVQEIMLTMYKDEVKAFARNSSLIFREIPVTPAPPVNRCRMRRGRGRCRGTAGELALTQMCAYHQERHTGDLHVDGLRCMSASNPGLFRLSCRRTTAPVLANDRLQIVRANHRRREIHWGNYGPYR